MICNTSVIRCCFTCWPRGKHVVHMLYFTLRARRRRHVGLVRARSNTEAHCVLKGRALQRRCESAHVGASKKQCVSHSADLIISVPRVQTPTIKYLRAASGINHASSYDTSTNIPNTTRYYNIRVPIIMCWRARKFRYLTV